MKIYYQISLVVLFLIVTITVVHAEEKEATTFENSTSLGWAKDLKDSYDKGIGTVLADKAKEKSLDFAEEQLGKLIGGNIPIVKIIDGIKSGAETAKEASKNIQRVNQEAILSIEEEEERTSGIKKKNWTDEQKRKVQQEKISQAKYDVGYGLMVTAADALDKKIKETKQAGVNAFRLPGEAVKEAYKTTVALYDSSQTQKEFDEAFKGDKGKELLEKVDKLNLANSGRDDVEVQKLQSQLDDMKSGQEKTGQEKRKEWFDWEPPKDTGGKIDTAMDLTRSARNRLDELEEKIVAARVSPGSVTEEELKNIEKDFATIKAATDKTKESLRNLDIEGDKPADIKDRNRVYKNTTSVQRTIDRLEGVKGLIETKEQKQMQQDDAEGAPASGAAAGQDEGQTTDPTDEGNLNQEPAEKMELEPEPVPEPESLPICDDSSGTDSNCRPAEEPTIDSSYLDNEGVCDQSCDSGQTPSCGKVNGQWHFTCIENEPPAKPDGPPPEEDWGLADWQQANQQANIEANEKALKEIAEREARIKKEREEDWASWRENGFELPEFKLPEMNIAGSDNQWRTYSWAEVFASNKSMRIAYLNVWQLAKSKEHNLKLAKQATYKALGLDEDADSWKVSQIYSQQFKALQNLYNGRWIYSPMDSKAYAEYMSLPDYNEPERMGGKLIQLHTHPAEMLRHIDYIRELQNQLRGDKAMTLSVIEQFNQKQKGYQNFYQSNFKKINIINQNLSSILPLDYQGKPNLYIDSPAGPGGLAEVAFRVQQCKEGIKQLDKTIQELETARSRIIKDTATAMAMLKPVADRVAEIKSYERGSGQEYNAYHNRYFDKRGSKPYDTMSLQELQRLAVQLGLSDFGSRYNQASEQLQSKDSTSLVGAYNSIFKSLRKFGSDVGLRVSYDFVNAANGVDFRFIGYRLLGALKRATASYIEDNGQLPPLPPPGDTAPANTHLYKAMIDRDVVSEQQNQSNELLAKIKTSDTLDKRRSLIASLCASIPEETNGTSSVKAENVDNSEHAPSDVSSLIRSPVISMDVYKTIASAVVSEPSTVAQQELSQKCKSLREDLAQREAAAIVVTDATVEEDPLKELKEAEAKKAAEAKKLADEEAEKLAAEEKAAEEKRLAEEEALELARQKQQDIQEIVDTALLDLKDLKQTLDGLPSGEDSREKLEDSVDQGKDIVADAKTELAALSAEDKGIIDPLDRELNLITELATKKIAEVSSEAPAAVSAKIQGEIQRLYQDFSSAYSSKNLGAITALISEDWSSADGSDIIDLEDVLDNSFSVFEQISYSVSGLNIGAIGDNRYEVKYNSKIVGHISSQGINHTEEGQLVEIVGFEDGVLLIMETQSGQFWR